MQTGQARSTGWQCGHLGSLLVLLAGCATDQARLSRALLEARLPTALASDLDRCYQVHCPDVVEVAVAGVLPGVVAVPITPDGRLTLSEEVRLRVAGLTTPEIARLVARHYDIDPEQVCVRVVAYNSRQLFLYGPISGGERVVTYQGPETVLEVLQRAGGLSPGASVENVHIIRSHVADGKPPEVFHVDLAAIVKHHDQHTNVLVEPFDQIYVGQSRRAKLCPCLPPWLRPFYERASGMKRR